LFDARLGRSERGRHLLVKEYYARRSAEYEAIYARPDPIRQTEQALLAAELKDHLAARRVLEVACGTGYWTQFLSETAMSVVAFDVNPEMLSIARSKSPSRDNVVFALGDAYALDSIKGDFDGALLMFWLSHIPRRPAPAFVDALHSRLSSGARVFMADNVYVPGVGGHLSHDADGPDTYKIRTLSDGSTHRVLKNYHTHDALEELLSTRATDLDIRFGTCFWLVKYSTP
jgi:SAM-dependent methyltransferase